MRDGKGPTKEMPDDAPWQYRLARGVGSVAGDFVPSVIGALPGVTPAVAQFGRGGCQRADTFRRILGVTDDSKLASVGIELMDEMGNNLDLALIKIELARRLIA